MLRFNFKESNNEAEYEAVVVGLGLAQELGVEDIEVLSDSMLIVNQVTGEFQVKEERIAKYLGKVKTLLNKFKSHLVTRTPRSENNEADALARLASRNGLDCLISFSIERLDQPSIEREELVLCSEKIDTWIDPITDYLTMTQLPKNWEEARRINNTSAR